MNIINNRTVPIDIGFNGIIILFNSQNNSFILNKIKLRYFAGS